MSRNRLNTWLGKYAEMMLAGEIQREPPWWPELLGMLDGYKGAQVERASIIGDSHRKVDVSVSFKDKKRHQDLGFSVKSFKERGFNQLERRNPAEFCERYQIKAEHRRFLERLILRKAKAPSKLLLVPTAQDQELVKKIFAPIAPGPQALMGSDHPQFLALYDDLRGLWHIYLTRDMLHLLRGEIGFSSKGGNISIGAYVSIQRKGSEGGKKGSSATDIKHPSNNLQVKMYTKRFFNRINPASSFAMEKNTRNLLVNLHDFWYCHNSSGWPSKAQLKNWFNGSEEFDRQIKEGFTGFPEDMRARTGDFDACLTDPVTATGLILCFDQVPRNIFRRQAKAFAYDGLAIELAEKLSGGELFGRLTPSQKLFALMPYQHVEDRALQDKSVALFEAFAAEAPAAQRELSEGMADYARKHRDLIARFGRFPHRNEVLGRKSTEEELAYLDGGGDRFGQ